MKASGGFSSVQGAAASRPFPPQYQSADKAKEAILHVIRREPAFFGIDRTRWRLTDILDVCDWLQVRSISSLGHVLERLGIAYKRARDYVHSPDPDYTSKVDYLQHLLAQARSRPDLWPLFYEDELTYYRQPSLASAFEESGHLQPKAIRSLRANTLTRVAALLEATTGRVLYRQATRIDTDQLVRLYRDLRQAYPKAERLYVATDNWPVHFHPDVLVALEPQQCPWPRYVPTNWPQRPSTKAVRLWGDLNLPIQLVPLPTYASWLNPIEKLWRFAKQKLLHLHTLADDLASLREAFAHLLDGFQTSSPELLRYVGLMVPS